MTFQKSSTRAGLMLGIIAILLSIPAIAQLFTKEVDWDLVDFAAAAALLLGTALCIELIFRFVKTTKARMLLIAVCLLALLVLWAEMAVGIFGSPIAGS